jgi:hypothetical protein
VELTESALVSKQDYSGQTKVVQGTVRNTSDQPLDYVQANAQFLNSDAVVIGTFLSNTENLQPGQGWAFEVDYHSETNTPVSEVTDYHVFAETA